MRSFTDSLFQLVQDGIIAPREAYLKAVDKLSLEQKFTAAGIPVDKTLSELPVLGSDGLDLSGADLNSPVILKKKAWRLSTDRNTQARDGIKAVELINRALTLGERDAATLMILAAAQAEIKDFKTAVETVREALTLAKQEKNADCLRELPQHLNYYRKSQSHPGV
jgi:hypothetical protein